MDIVFTYSHLGGQEILMVRYPEYLKEIIDVINSVEVSGRTKVSKEKSMPGCLLFSPIEINSIFKDKFRELGWERARDYFDISIPNYPCIVERSYKEYDFRKGYVMVEVQLGKYPFMFYDLAKFQYFFNQGLIQLSVEIVPNDLLHKEMSSGTSYGEQLINDLERLSKNFPSVPVMIILVDIPLEFDDYKIETREKIRSSFTKTCSLIQEWIQKDQ